MDVIGTCAPSKLFVCANRNTQVLYLLLIYSLIYCIYILYQYYLRVLYVTKNTVRMTITRYRLRDSEDTGTTCGHASNGTTEAGHVVGLLDRDQRTALSRPKFDDMRAVLVSQPSSPPCSCDRTTFRPHRQPQLSRTGSLETKRHLLRRTLHSK